MSEKEERKKKSIYDGLKFQSDLIRQKVEAYELESQERRAQKEFERELNRPPEIEKFYRSRYFEPFYQEITKLIFHFDQVAKIQGFFSSRSRDSKSSQLENAVYVSGTNFLGIGYIRHYYCMAKSGFTQQCD